MDRALVRFVVTASKGSAAPVRLIELRTHDLHRKSIGITKSRTTGSESGPLRGYFGR
jgi:hypothetical protein